MPKTLHETNYDILKGQATTVAGVAHGHPVPDAGQLTMITNILNQMDKQVKLYCTKTPGTEAVLKNYNTAKTEVPVLAKLVQAHPQDATKIKAATKVIEDAMKVISTSHYVAPPATTPPPRPSTPAPTTPPAGMGAPARPTSAPGSGH